MDTVDINSNHIIDPHTAFMAKWLSLKHWLYCQWLWKVRRKIPIRVWYGDEVDVTVSFTDLRLASNCTLENLRYEGDIETIWRAESALHQLGLTFDAGTGLEGRDWEWDWFLSRPVHLKFRCKHKGKREPKEPRPALRLVKNERNPSPPKAA
jgi:hypothetical protein